MGRDEFGRFASEDAPSRDDAGPRGGESFEEVGRNAVAIAEDVMFVARGLRDSDPPDDVAFQHAQAATSIESAIVSLERADHQEADVVYELSKAVTDLTTAETLLADIDDKLYGAMPEGELLDGDQFDYATASTDVRTALDDTKIELEAAKNLPLSAFDSDADEQMWMAGTSHLRG